MSDEITAAFELQQKVNDQYTQLDMATSLLDEVIERTENFREGHYSHKRIRDLGRSAQKNLQQNMNAAETMADVMSSTEMLLQDFKNIQATIITEIERLDK